METVQIEKDKRNNHIVCFKFVQYIVQFIILNITLFFVISYDYLCNNMNILYTFILMFTKAK